MLLFRSLLFSLLYSIILLFCPLPSCSFCLYFPFFFPSCLSLIVIFSRASIIDQRSLLSLTLSVNSPPLMEPGGLLPSLQELVTGTSFGNADETIANCYTLFLSNQLLYYPHIYLWISQAVSSFVSRFTSCIYFLILQFVVQATGYTLLIDWIQNM